MTAQERTRRRFLLEAGAAVGAGVSVTAFGGPAFSDATRPAATIPPGGGDLSGIDHVVVLMLENRSFDNVLGWLYDPANPPPFDRIPEGQSFDGFSGKDLSNPVPGGGIAVPGRETVLSNPDPDPGEVFADVYAAMFDTTDPPEPNRTDVPGMQGFVNNYAAVIERTTRHRLTGGSTPASS